MKELISEHCIATAAAEGRQVLTVDSDALITPSARDAADAAGIEIKREQCAGDLAPYCSEQDPAGLKIVRGATVRLDYLDTGNAANKVHYQETLSSAESPVMNAGFLEIDSCVFDWEVGCDEMYYVICGPLWITVGGRRYVAETGDFVNLPVGSKIQLGAPGKARLFYGIKAA